MESQQWNIDYHKLIYSVQPNAGSISPFGPEAGSKPKFKIRLAKGALEEAGISFPPCLLYTSPSPRD